MRNSGKELDELEEELNELEEELNELEKKFTRKQEKYETALINAIRKEMRLEQEMKKKEEIATNTERLLSNVIELETSLNMETTADVTSDIEAARIEAEQKYTIALEHKEKINTSLVKANAEVEDARDARDHAAAHKVEIQNMLEDARAATTMETLTKIRENISKLKRKVTHEKELEFFKKNAIKKVEKYEKVLINANAHLTRMQELMKKKEEIVTNTMRLLSNASSDIDAERIEAIINYENALEDMKRFEAKLVNAAMEVEDAKADMKRAQDAVKEYEDMRDYYREHGAIIETRTYLGWLDNFIEEDDPEYDEKIEAHTAKNRAATQQKRAAAKATRAPMVIVERQGVLPEEQEEERRIDLNDGNSYTKQEFIDYYGDVDGSNFWDMSDEYSSFKPGSSRAHAASTTEPGSSRAHAASTTEQAAREQVDPATKSRRRMPLTEEQKSQAASKRRAISETIRKRKGKGLIRIHRHIAKTKKNMRLEHLINFSNKLLKHQSKQRNKKNIRETKKNIKNTKKNKK